LNEAYLTSISCDYEMIFKEDVEPFIKRLSVNSHKDNRGKLVVIGGSYQYTGAPILAGMGALKTGAGRVTVVLPKYINPLFSISEYSLIFNHVGDGKCFNDGVIPSITKIIKNGDAVVFGPGVTSSKAVSPLLVEVLNRAVPLVLDADGLNLLAKNPNAIKNRDVPTILTPHPGEMKRLLAAFELDIECSRIDQAKTLANRTNSVVVLKGFRTVIASPTGRVVINSSGTAGLATAGTGDVLAGVIGAFLAQGEEAFEAACMAVFVHGFASELSPYGMRGLTATTLIDLLPEALFDISPFA
jgi:NAD(P)H-hydrate epimerase